MNHIDPFGNRRLCDCGNLIPAFGGYTKCPACTLADKRDAKSEPKPAPVRHTPRPSRAKPKVTTKCLLCGEPLPEGMHSNAKYHDKCRSKAWRTRQPGYKPRGVGRPRTKPKTEPKVYHCLNCGEVLSGKSRKWCGDACRMQFSRDS